MLFSVKRGKQLQARRPYRTDILGNLQIVLHHSAQEGRGTSHMKTYGMCGSNGSPFHKKSLNMGPIFYKNILKHGFLFPKFSGVRMANPLKL